MPSVTLTDDEAESIATALELWSNYIQTGTVTHSLADLAARNAPKLRPRPLDVAQMERVVALAKLRERLLRETGR